MELLTGSLVAVGSQIIKLFSARVEIWLVDVFGEEAGKKLVSAFTLLTVFAVTFVAVVVFRYFRLAETTFWQELLQSFASAIATYEVIIKRVGILQR